MNGTGSKKSGRALKENLQSHFHRNTTRTSMGGIFTSISLLGFLYSWSVYFTSFAHSSHLHVRVAFLDKVCTMTKFSRCNKIMPRLRLNARQATIPIVGDVRLQATYNQKKDVIYGPKESMDLLDQ